MLNRASTYPRLAPEARVRAAGDRYPAAFPTVQVHSRFRRLSAPIIVVGMHRSGTSLVSGMLGALGVYMGPELQSQLERGEAFWADPAAAESGYGEADDFRGVNDQLLAVWEAGWDRIDPVLDCNPGAVASEQCLRIASRATHGRLRTSFLAEAGPLFAGRWGWKDPRSSLTLPVWLALFPRALVVHVRRDRTAAVDSLYRRAVAWSRRTPPMLTLRQRAAWAMTHPVSASKCVARKLGWLPTPVGTPDPCLDREYCAQLYDGYVSVCRKHATLGQQYVELQYEELLASPRATVRRMVGLLDLSAGDDQMAMASAMVRRRDAVAEARPALAR